MVKNQLTQEKDVRIQGWLNSGRLRVDLENGLVYSSARDCRGVIRDKPLGVINKGGYLQTGLSLGGGAIDNILLHRVVAIAAYGIPDPGMQVCHLNHDKLDNRVSNLAFGTASENSLQSADAGIAHRHEANGRAKASWPVVRMIRKIYANGLYNQAQLGLMFGLSNQQVSNIIRRESWSLTSD